MVEAGGREDNIEVEELAGEGEDAQLEPGPENCFWHVPGSHQAGPVSHYGNGGSDTDEVSKTIHNDYRLLTHPAPLPVDQLWSAGFKGQRRWREGGVSKHTAGSWSTRLIFVLRTAILAECHGYDAKHYQDGRRHFGKRLFQNFST